MTKKQNEEVEKKIPSLKRLIAEINKNVGENIIGRISDMKDIETERISTGVKRIDDALGGGFPTKRIVELYGFPSGGKSLISLTTIAQAQKKGLECVYIDLESSFDPKFAERLGVDSEKIILVQSTTAEKVMDLICQLLEGEPGVIVVDSVAAMVTETEFEEDFEKIMMAPKARLLSRALAKINLLNKNTLIIFINQLRETMTMYGPKTATTGGRALGHYASIRMEIKKGEKIHEDDKRTKDVIGQIISFIVAKNKTYAPFKTGSFKFMYENCQIIE